MFSFLIQKQLEIVVEGGVLLVHHTLVFMVFYLISYCLNDDSSQY